jgi:hypothetical protein
MLIEFLCPNGHRIHCDSQRSGLAAKCPKCGQKFRIPTPAELESAAAVAGDRAAPQPGGDPSQSAAPASTAPESAISPGPAMSADQIEFLCPNNHLIHAPAQLQGKPGQCPQCGSTFRVPSYDEFPADEGQSESTAMDVLGDSDIAMGDQSPLDEPEAGIAAAGRERRWPSRPVEASAATAAHPFFELFCRLWSQTAAAASIEIHYGETQDLTPDRFARSLSAGSHAVFAVDEPDGTYTLTAIPWAAISAVVIRGMRSLPEGMET